MTSRLRFLSLSLTVIWTVLTCGFREDALASVALVAADPVPIQETSCSRADSTPGLPARLSFRIIDENQIEAWAWDRINQQTPVVRLQAQDIPSQPGLALFNVAGQLTVSGDAKLLITRTALKYRNVGRLLFTNRTTGELSTYHCR